MLNTDGAQSKENICGGIGGVIRDTSGWWIINFENRIIFLNYISTKLQVKHYELKMTLDHP